MNKTDDLRKLLIERFAQTVEHGAMCEECCSNQGHVGMGEGCEMSEKPLQPDDYCPQQLDAIDSVIPEIEKIYRMTNTWCAYCGKEYPLDTVTADQIGEHIATCEKHPLYQAKKQIREIFAEIDRLKNIVGIKIDGQGEYIGKEVVLLEDLEPLKNRLGVK